MRAYQGSRPCQMSLAGIAHHVTPGVGMDLGGGRKLPTAEQQGSAHL